MLSKRSTVAKMVCMVAMTASMGLSPSTARAAESAAISQVQRYCTTSWSRAGIARQDWSDCTQETLLRLLTRVSRERLAVVFADSESDERRELHRAVWRTVQRWRRAPRGLPLDDSTLIGPLAPKQADDRADALAAVWQRLSPRQRDILTLWSQGWSVQEIAFHSNISPARVSDDKYKAIGKLRRELRESAS